MPVGELSSPPTARLLAWCAQAVGQPVTEVLFRSGNLSRVLGLALRDGREVVLKARPASPRHVGCVAVQRRLAAAGYPCPRPLAGPQPLGADDVTVETYLPGGSRLDLHDDAAARFGAALAELVRRAPAPSEVPCLDPPPPWAAWDHAGPGLWPVPVSGIADLDAADGPRWLDDVGRRVRARLGAQAEPPVVGHVDFESQNIRWAGRRLHCVDDWDSVAARPEAAVAGLAAAAFPAVDRAAAAASLTDTQRFLDAYARARGRPWTREEVQVAWAAGLWTLAYNARVQAAEGSHALAERLAGDVERRLLLAGA